MPYDFVPLSLFDMPELVCCEVLGVTRTVIKHWYLRPCCRLRRSWNRYHPHWIKWYRPKLSHFISAANFGQFFQSWKPLHLWLRRPACEHGARQSFICHVVSCTRLRWPRRIAIHRFSDCSVSWARPVQWRGCRWIKTVGKCGHHNDYTVSVYLCVLPFSFDIYPNPSSS